MPCLRPFEQVFGVRSIDLLRAVVAVGDPCSIVLGLWLLVWELMNERIGAIAGLGRIAGHVLCFPCLPLIRVDSTSLQGPSDQHQVSVLRCDPRLLEVSIYDACKVCWGFSCPKVIIS